MTPDSTPSPDFPANARIMARFLDASGNLKPGVDASEIVNDENCYTCA